MESMKDLSKKLVETDWIFDIIVCVAEEWVITVLVGLIPYNHHRAKVTPRKGHTFHCFIIGTLLVKKLGSLRLVENLNQ